MYVRECIEHNKETSLICFSKLKELFPAVLYTDENSWHVFCINSIDHHALLLHLSPFFYFLSRTLGPLRNMTAVSWRAQMDFFFDLWTLSCVHKLLFCSAISLLCHLQEHMSMTSVLILQVERIWASCLKCLHGHFNVQPSCDICFHPHSISFFSYTITHPFKHIDVIFFFLRLATHNITTNLIHLIN